MHNPRPAAEYSPEYVFTSIHGRLPYKISIELLPGDGSDWLGSAPVPHAPFLFINFNLGVPTKHAYKAYLEAVARFRAVHRTRSPNLDVISKMLTSTAVLLLANPAHETALNARKQLVTSSLLSAPHEPPFTDALFTLRERAKQSLLWAHRRWPLEQSQ